MVVHLVHTVSGSQLAVALADVASIDMWCQEQEMVELAAVNFDLVGDIGILAVAPKCTFASDYVDK